MYGACIGKPHRWLQIFDTQVDFPFPVQSVGWFHPSIKDLKHPSLGKPRLGLQIFDIMWISLSMNKVIVDSVNHSTKSFQDSDSNDVPLPARIFRPEKQYGKKSGKQFAGFGRKEV